MSKCKERGLTKEATDVLVKRAFLEDLLMEPYIPTAVGIGIGGLGGAGLGALLAGKKGALYGGLGGAGLGGIVGGTLGHAFTEGKRTQELSDLFKRTLEEKKKREDLLDELFGIESRQGLKLRDMLYMPMRQIQFAVQPAGINEKGFNRYPGGYSHYWWGEWEDPGKAEKIRSLLKKLFELDKEDY
jgi:hypothetical protein